MTLSRLLIVALTGATLAAPAAAQASIAPRDVQPSYTPTVLQDLRSPDARDAAAGRGTTSPQVVVVPARRVAPPAASDSSNGWGDAALGAGGTLALMLAAVGGSVLVARRRSLSLHR
jgi:hypothetical protein